MNKIAINAPKKNRNILYLFLSLDASESKKSDFSREFKYVADQFSLSQIDLNYINTFVMSIFNKLNMTLNNLCFKTLAL